MGNVFTVEASGTYSYHCALYVCVCVCVCVCVVCVCAKMFPSINIIS